MASAEFSSIQAALRIRRVQQLCKQHGLDGVVLIPGVDGKFSVCNQAMGYLFEGRSNRDTIDVVKLGGQLDEAVALVTPSTVCLYAPNPAVYKQLQELLVPNVLNMRMLGPTKAEAADPDLLEENKLASFVHMMRGCKRLGVPCALAPEPLPGRTPAAAAALSNGGPPHIGLPQLTGSQLMLLERWPLLQAYGLEGVGRSGFFTMNFEVFDVQSALQHQLYGQLDGRALAALLAEALPALRQHWDEALGALGGRAPGQRGALSEKQVAEPLAGYFAYGLLRPVLGVEQAVTLPPRVVFGPRTSDDSASSEAAPLASCGPAPGCPPLHGVLEAADPRSPLRVARTYFLARGVANRNVFADPDEEAEEGYSFTAATAGWEGQAADVVLLMRLYTALVEAAQAAMGHFATVDTATAHSAKAVAQEVLARRAEQLGVAAAGAGGGGGGGQALAAKLRFALWQCDHANHVTTPAVRGSRQLKVLRLSLPDIPSRSGPTAGKTLGGLVYGDTFMELPRGGSSSTHRPPLLVLTEGVQALVAVPAGGCEEDLAARALRSLAAVVDRSADDGSQSMRAANLASQRNQERRAAAAAAESEVLAARMRALRAGTPGQEGQEDLEDLEEEVAAAKEAARSAPAAAAPAVRPSEALGRLLTVGGGEDAVILTGAPSCPALSGTLYCFSAGLVFVEAASRAVWALDLRRGGEPGSGSGGGVEAITMQQLSASRGPAWTPNGARGGALANGGGAVNAEGPSPPSPPDLNLGEAVVLRGCSPACGLAPACHLTTNNHVALALAAMSPAARRFLITSVLPAWQQTCREAAAAAAESHSAWAPSYLKDMSAPNPFPPALHRAHAYAIQSSSAGGAAKTWPAVAAEDEEVTGFLEEVDAAELYGPLSGLDPRVESLLLQPPPPPPTHASASSTPGGSVTLVVGLPGADQSAVASALATMLGDDALPLVAQLPQAAGTLRAADFEAALAAAAAAAPPPRGTAVRHLVLATSSYTGLYEQLGMLAAAAVGGAAGRWRLAGVVACVSADAAWEEPARGALAGGLLAQLAPGCVDCVVLGGADAAKVAVLAELVSSRLPDVPQVRSGRSQLLRAREELLPKAAERATRLSAPAAVAARRWAPLQAAPAPAPAPSAGASGGSRAWCWDVPGCSSGGLLGPLQCCAVAFEGEVDVARLRAALAELGVPQDPARVPHLPLVDPSRPSAASGGISAVTADGGESERAVSTSAAAGGGGGGGGLVCVRGCVRLTASARPSELVGTRQAGLRAREWPLAEAAVITGAPALPADRNTAGGELTFIGYGSAVSEHAVRRLLARCGAGPGGSAPLGTAVSPPLPRAASQLTPAQRSAIRQAHLFDPLPEGYCFNGTQYFDAFGDASFEHPEMDRFIAEWLAEQGSKAAAAATSGVGGGHVVVRLAGPVPL